MNYCSECGSPVELRIPDGDTKPRHVCPRCATIHYLNPKVIVGCIAEWQGKVLLCRRAIEPAYGKWTLPAGFLENGETTAGGAARETLEEAGATIAPEALFALISIPAIAQVHLFYRGTLACAEYFPGTESLDVGLFNEDEIPWPELAFASVASCLRRYFADRRHGRFSVHEEELPPLPETS